MHVIMRTPTRTLLRFLIVKTFVEIIIILCTRIFSTSSLRRKSKHPKTFVRFLRQQFARAHTHELIFMCDDCATASYFHQYQILLLKLNFSKGFCEYCNRRVLRADKSRNRAKSQKSSNNYLSSASIVTDGR